MVVFPAVEARRAWRSIGRSVSIRFDTTSFLSSYQEPFQPRYQPVTLTVEEAIARVPMWQGASDIKISPLEGGWLATTQHCLVSTGNTNTLQARRRVNWASHQKWFSLFARKVIWSHDSFLVVPSFPKSSASRKISLEWRIPYKKYTLCCQSPACSIPFKWYATTQKSHSATMFNSLRNSTGSSAR